VSDWRTDPGWPDVDVVMPIRNEAAHLSDALAAIGAQDYPGRIGVFMAVGPSDDGTDEVAAALAARHPALSVIANPDGSTPRALNLAIQEGTAPVIVRVDGHSQLSDGYIVRAVDTLRRTGAANVGGMQVPVATTPFEEAVAAATTSWLGTGGSSYRLGGTEAEVDTVYLGVFDRAAIESVGLFDERLLRNQDYELNIRLRKAGRAVVFDPELSVGYVPRSSWSSLWQQYHDYGQWKAVVLRLHPDSLQARQAIAPAGVLVALASGLGALRRGRWGAPAAAYLVLITASALRQQRFVTVTAVQVTIHLSWTLGLLRGGWRRRIGDSRR
jgi:succinoglycan biosynthesis protein ExoA